MFPSHDRGGNSSVDDIALTNADQGPVIFATSTVNTETEFNGKALTSNNYFSNQPAEYDFYETADGAQRHTRAMQFEGCNTIRPSIRFDYRNWFEQDGNAQLIKAGATTSDLPTLFLFTPGASGDISTILPEPLWGKRCRIRMRAQAVSVSSLISFFSGSSLGASTTARTNSYTLGTSWEEFELVTTDFVLVNSSEPYLTITKNTNEIRVEYIAVEVMNDQDVLVVNNNPENFLFGDPGQLCQSRNGFGGSFLFVKESGTGTNTGWVGK